MNTANAPRKFSFKNILPRPFRRDTSDKEGALNCTVSERASAHTLVNERQPPNASNEEKASHPVVKIVQKTIPCISRKAVKTHFEEEDSKGGMDFMDPALNIEPAPSVRPEGIVTISPMISPILVQGVLVPSPTLVHLHDSDFPFSTGTEDPVQSVQNHTHSGLRVSCAELASLTGANNANIGGTRLPAITGHDCAESISDYGTGTTASDYWPGANSNMLDVSNIPEILVDDTTSFELGDGYSEGAADASPPVPESHPPVSGFGKHH
ncbi:hypothetical protein CPC08DRAFT_821451 [Agrocybe pediades]|nr:hypothetical protein CPC08DRAFT_821451 [Agrocybe pediades]